MDRGEINLPPSPETEQAQRFDKLDKVSSELTGKVISDQEMEGVPPESRLKISAFAKKEITGQLGNMDFGEIIDAAVEKGWKIVIYNGGVAWTGDQWAAKETPDNPKTFGEVIKSKLSPEEQTEQSKKVAALDFLADGGFDLCLTIDPEKATGFISNLRADMIARRLILQSAEKKLDKGLVRKGEGLLTEVDWSNGTHKGHQIEVATFQAVTKKIVDGDAGGDDRGIFRSYMEAVQYGSLRGKLKLDTYYAAGPAGPDELAVPFTLANENPLVRKGSEKGRDLANWLIKKLNKVPPKYIPQGMRMLGTRVMEMGAGKRAAEVKTGDALITIQGIMRSLLGEARIVTLADTSGRTVTSDRQHVGDDMKLIYGDKAIMIETHEEKPRPELKNAGPNELQRRYGKSLHDELKQPGVYGKLAEIVKQIREGTFSPARNEQERFVVVSPEAKIYVQKKGTQVRYSPPKILSGTG